MVRCRTGIRSFAEKATATTTMSGRIRIVHEDRGQPLGRGDGKPFRPLARRERDGEPQPFPRRSPREVDRTSGDGMFVAVHRTGRVSSAQTETNSHFP